MAVPCHESDLPDVIVKVGNELSPRTEDLLITHNEILVIFIFTFEPVTLTYVLRVLRFRYAMCFIMECALFALEFFFPNLHCYLDSHIARYVFLCVCFFYSLILCCARPNGRTVKYIRLFYRPDLISVNSKPCNRICYNTQHAAQFVIWEFRNSQRNNRIRWIRWNTQWAFFCYDHQSGEFCYRTIWWTT